ncbi:MAG: hypothetical protein JWN04_175 [Myxococcaceae bacterium]|nr:hypothetical protein [Myxococcaceae bacterium]
MIATVQGSRHVKGSNVIDLVKFVKTLQKRGPLPPLSPAAEQLLEARLLNSTWYAFEPFVELLQVVDKLVLRSDEGRAMEMGVVGGTVALQGPAKLYLQPNDPRATVVAMRHAWRARHDFADLVASMDGDRAVRFTLSDYPDISMVHALTTAGWGIAAARAAGSTLASLDVLERPWRGASSFCYRINY